MKENNMNNEKVNSIVEKFFYQMEDYLNIHVNGIELEPIHLYDNIYVVALRENENDKDDPYEMRVKELESIRVQQQEILVGEDYGLWMSLSVFSNTTAQNLVNSFKTNLLALTTFHIAKITIQDIENAPSREIVNVYENKRTAYKDILKMRKLYYSVKSKFHEFNIHQTLDFKSDLEVALEPAEVEA